MAAVAAEEVVTSTSPISSVGKWLRWIRLSNRWVVVVVAAFVVEDAAEAALSVLLSSMGVSVTVHASPRRNNGGPLAMAATLADAEDDDDDDGEAEGSWASRGG